MKLSAELLKDCLSYLNPLKERELDLRGNRIPQIEDLAIVGPHDAIDFTDNDVQVLGNFPLSPRLETLLFARNQIVGIQPGLANVLPNLKNLSLASNNLAELAELDVLGSFERLTHLVLIDNPVTKKEHYRSWVLWRCPSVRFLDHQKVKKVERDKGHELFGTPEEPTVLATQIQDRKSRLPEKLANGSVRPAKKKLRVLLTEDEKEKVRARILNATNMAEINALELELNEGRLADGDATEQ